MITSAKNSTKKNQETKNGQTGPRTAMKSSLRSPQLEKAHAQQRRPKAAKKK